MLRKWLADALIASGSRRESGGGISAACRRYRAAAVLAPRYAPAHLNLGAALEAAGNARAALRAYESAFEVEPDNPYASYNLGRLHYANGDFAEAEQKLRLAVQGKPDFSDALVALANAQEAQGAFANAAESLKAALERRPRHAGTWYNYAEVLWKLARPDEAEAALHSALEADPGHPYANFHVARLKHARGDLAGAASLLETTLRQKPDFIDAWCLRGEVLLKLERLDDAEKMLRRALVLDPTWAAAWYLLGLTLRAMARIAESLEALAAAVRLAPQRFEYEPAKLLVLTLADDVSAQTLFARHRDYGARLEAHVAQRFRAWRGDRERERRLRIGFVSCDFNRHPVAWFTLPLFEHLDRARCEVYCYSVGAKADEVTAQVRAAADVWREASALGDEELADAVHADTIDILVDLIGHAGIARLGVFAQQPAPVQASWLGYLHSTGLTRMQYRITDARADPRGSSERLHTERLAYLPHSMWCYRATLALEHAPAPPCVRCGHVTFGSFQHAPKLSRTVRRLWVEILRTAPQARLRFVGVPEGRTRDDLLRDFGAAGVEPSRLAILPRLPLEAYLRQYDEVDIALDTTPYGGGTTSLEALWMGVPVLTLAGDRSAARSAASILGTLGLDEWVATSAQDYVRLALEHAADHARIAALRGSLRQWLSNSPLMDEVRFARDMQAVFRAMWYDWCSQPVS